MADLATLDLATLKRLHRDPRMGEVQLGKIASRIAELEEPAVAVVDLAKPKKPAAHVRGVMNQTEARYARDVMDIQVAGGTCLRYEFEGLTFRIPEIGIYTPDFVGWMADGSLWCHEVKNRQIWPKDVIKFKAAARERPWIRWTLTQWKDGRWTVLHNRGGNA